MRIYVGNLSKDTDEKDLQQLFEEFGQIDTVTIIKDKYTGQSKGFGFVDIPSKEEGQSAIEGLNNKELKGNSIKVNEARPRRDNQSRFASRNYGGNQGSYKGKTANNRGKYREYRGRRGGNR